MPENDIRKMGFEKNDHQKKWVFEKNDPKKKGSYGKNDPKKKRDLRKNRILEKYIVARESPSFRKYHTRLRDAAQTQ